MERYKRRGKKLLYLDETGFEATTERQYGLAAIGKRVHDTRVGSIRKRTSLIAAWCNKYISAPMLFEGTCNTNVFNTWIEKFLCPELDKETVVIMDNATFHKSAETKTLIEDTGATLLFLPPYSPDLNPIEKVFGTLKRIRSESPNIHLDQLVTLKCK